MNMLFGSIILIQILAHLPLADIWLPANAHQQFDLMIGVVSFDYFSPTEYIDAGFSEMPSWSENFEWLGYESINFVEGMGSIIIFAAWFLIQIIVSLVALRLSCCCKRFKKCFALNKVASASLEFVDGTFFEIMVCVSVSMAMLEYKEFLNTADTVSVIFQFVFAAVLVAYLGFLSFFTACKVSLLSKKKASALAKKRQKYQERANRQLL